MENNKIFLIKSVRGNYDDFASAVVLAKNETEAFEICRVYLKDEKDEDLNERKQFIEIEEISLEESRVLLTSSYMI